MADMTEVNTTLTESDFEEPLETFKRKKFMAEARIS